MKEPVSAARNPQTHRTSIKRIIVVFSVLLFSLILIGGSAVFLVFMRQTVRATIGYELSQTIEIERFKLESSVNAEIAIAMKMAGSPLIQEYFANPDDPELSRLAFTEIAAYRAAFSSKSAFWVNDTDRLFYSDDNAPFFVDADNPDNYWYRMTLNETAVYNFNINYNPDLQVTNLWINAPVFDRNRKLIGIIGTGINLSTFIDAIYKSYSGSVELYFFNAAGEITGSRDLRLVIDKVTINGQFGNIGANILSRAVALNER